MLRPRDSVAETQQSRVSVVGRMLLLAGGALLWWLLAAGPGVAEEWPEAAPPSLTAALRQLQEAGLPVVFTSRVVTPELRVRVPPSATEPREILDQLLAPHGLEIREGPGGTLVVVVAPVLLRGSVTSRLAHSPLAGVAVRILDPDRGEVLVETVTGADGRFELAGLEPGPVLLEARLPGFVVEQRPVEILGRGLDGAYDLVLTEAPVPQDEIVVTPSRVSLLHAGAAATVALDRDEILSLPHLGDDLFRALPLLPGATANDVTAQPQLRGGRRDEVQVILDGQELFEAYHLQDFDNALSVVAPATLDSVDLTLGGFPANFGDRAGGVLDMSTRLPRGGTRTRLGLSLLTLQVDGHGSWAGDRGGWLASLRRGSTDLAEDLLGQQQPVYWDAFAKLALQPTPSQSLRFHALYAGDTLVVDEENDEGFKHYDNDYDRFYLWSAHQAALGPKVFVDSALSWTAADSHRQALEVEDGLGLDLLDARELEVGGLRQSWSRELAAGEIEGGAELRRFEAFFDYQGLFEIEDPLAAVRPDGGEGDRSFRQETSSEHLGLHATARWRLGRFTSLQPGLRFDRYTLTREELFSPRLGMAWSLGPGTVVRAAWGIYYQSQRPYERQVADGATEIFPAERSEHRVLGLERLFGGRRGPLLRLELYERLTSNPRPRFENLFEGLNTFPELEPDRFLIEPEKSAARGFEVFLRGEGGPRWTWWVGYAHATTRDRLDGHWVPRKIEERDSLTTQLQVRLGRAATLALAWRYHSGWPTTPLGAALSAGEEDDEGETGELEVVPVLGRLNSDRLPAYHRLDLRYSRVVSRKSGNRWELFVDVQNLYDRRNVAGFDYQIEDDASIGVKPELWVGIFPSIGLRWEF